MITRGSRTHGKKIISVGFPPLQNRLITLIEQVRFVHIANGVDLLFLGFTFQKRTRYVIVLETVYIFTCVCVYEYSRVITIKSSKSYYCLYIFYFIIVIIF